MTERVPLMRLRAVAAAGALWITTVHAAGTADDPQSWLANMNQALAIRNYDGTFFHLSDGRVETMRIVHRVNAGRVTERLVSMDGSGREFISTNEQRYCYLPDQKTVLVQSREDQARFLGSLPQFSADANRFYKIKSLPSARILGRPTRVISIEPNDQFRFGYRLWLDEKTAMPLKTQLCDSRGQVVEQILFAKLEMPENIPESAVQTAVRTDGMRWIRQELSSDSAPAALGAFHAAQLPPGFRLAVTEAQNLGRGNSPASHLVYSDGVATVSVFVEDPPTDPPVALAQPNAPVAQGLTRVGAGYAFSTVVQGHQVTAVGEVPAQTVEFIAQSVTSTAVILPHH